MWPADVSQDLAPGDPSQTPRKGPSPSPGEAETWGRSRGPPGRYLEYAGSVRRPPGIEEIVFPSAHEPLACRRVAKGTSARGSLPWKARPTPDMAGCHGEVVRTTAGLSAGGGHFVSETCNGLTDPPRTNSLQSRAEAWGRWAQLGRRTVGFALHHSHCPSPKDSL